MAIHDRGSTVDVAASAFAELQAAGATLRRLSRELRRAARAGNRSDVDALRASSSAGRARLSAALRAVVQGDGTAASCEQNDDSASSPSSAGAAL